MTSIKLLLIVSLAVVGLRTSPSEAQQYATLPCPFNSMCSCKIARSSLPAMVAASSRGQHYSAAINGTFLNEHSLLLNPDETDDEEDEDVENEEGDSGDIIVKDVSCVGVPLASIPGIVILSVQFIRYTQHSFPFFTRKLRNRKSC